MVQQWGGEAVDKGKEKHTKREFSPSMSAQSSSFAFCEKSERPVHDASRHVFANVNVRTINIHARRTTYRQTECRSYRIKCSSHAAPYSLLPSCSSQNTDTVDVVQRSPVCLSQSTRKLVTLGSISMSLLLPSPGLGAVTHTSTLP